MAKDIPAYEVVEGWGRLPDGWAFTQVAGAAVDSKDRVYVLCRGEHPIIIFSADGEFIESWGEGVFGRAHGAYIDGEDNFYCVDDGNHTVRKFARDGELLFTLGTQDRPGSTGTRGKASSSSHGASRAQARASSTSPTASGSKEKGSTSPTARTVGYRSSPSEADTSRSGQGWRGPVTST
jgi:hypothetical protein